MTEQAGGQTSPRTMGLPTRLFRGVGLLTLIAIVLGAGYFVVKWQIEEPEVGFGTRVSHILRDLFESRTSERERLLTLEDRLGEVERTLERESLERQDALKAMEQGLLEIKERLDTVEEKEIPPVLLEGDLPLRLLTSLYRAQADLLKVRLEVLDGNWGRASQELDLAINALNRAKAAAGQPHAEIIDKLLADAANLKGEMPHQSVVANDLLELLWHRLADFAGNLAGSNRD